MYLTNITLNNEYRPYHETIDWRVPIFDNRMLYNVDTPIDEHAQIKTIQYTTTAELKVICSTPKEVYAIQNLLGREIDITDMRAIDKEVSKLPPLQKADKPCSMAYLKLEE